jgi:tryptophan halogenase
LNTADERVRTILVVGGNALAWLAAATLARRLPRQSYRLQVLETDPNAAGSFSIQALPSFGRLIALLGMDEASLMRRTRATFRLGCEFFDWHSPGERYFHGYGSVGAKLEAVAFIQHWLRLRSSGDGPELGQYSVAAVAARRGRFALPSGDPRSIMSLFSYGYHFDTASLAVDLRDYALAHGVGVLHGAASDAALLRPGGFVEGIRRTGEQIARADLYIDCDGPRGLLASAAEGAWMDWSRWLPCDRTVELRIQSDVDPAPYSVARAARSGWMWRTPLQSGADVGYAYSSRHCSDEEALRALRAEFAGPSTGDPRWRPITRARRRVLWQENCLHLESGPLDPVEPTALHLAQTAVTRLLSLFPARLDSEPDRDEYNRQTAIEYDRIRDMLALHYTASARADSPFWLECRAIEPPESLRDRIELFRDSGRLASVGEEHFSADSWISVLIGQHVFPEAHDPLADLLGAAEASGALAKMRGAIGAGVDALPAHGDFIRAHRAASDAGGA